ncbi:MAG: ROK family protein [Candidatus Omnitrophota bacterium]
MSKTCILAVDLGGTATKLALLNLRGKILKKISIPTRAYKGKKALIAAIQKTIQALLLGNGIGKSKVKGMGVGVPGLVDYNRGIIHNLINIPGWHNVALKDILQRKLKLPCFVDNDANVMALGELVFGAGKGAKNIVCLTVGTGVGGGIIINGKLYRGRSFSAGEIGHIPINEDGPHCNCKGNGCVEAYVGNRYVSKEVIKKLKRGEKSKVFNFVKRLSDITPEVLYKAAKRGDKFSKNMWNEIGNHLGFMLAGVVNLLNPERIIIGGGVSKAGKFLFEPLRRRVLRQAMAIPAKACRILPAKLGEDAGLIGAAALVMENT